MQIIYIQKNLQPHSRFHWNMSLFEHFKISITSKLIQYRDAYNHKNIWNGKTLRKLTNKDVLNPSPNARAAATSC